MLYFCVRKVKREEQLANRPRGRAENKKNAPIRREP